MPRAPVSSFETQILRNYCPLVEDSPLINTLWEQVHKLTSGPIIVGQLLTLIRQRFTMGPYITITKGIQTLEPLAEMINQPLVSVLKKTGQRTPHESNGFWLSVKINFFCFLV